MEIDLKTLAHYIKQEVRAEFNEVHLSGNLMNTIKVVKDGDDYLVKIPAEIYDFAKFWKEKVIIPTGKGSYASQLNEQGSEFWLYWQDKNGKWHKQKRKPRNHKNYIENAIIRAVARFSKENGWQITQEIL